MTVKIVELSFLGLSDIEDLCQIHMAGIVAPTLPCIPMSGFCNFGDGLFSWSTLHQASCAHHLFAASLFSCNTSKSAASAESSTLASIISFGLSSNWLTTSFLPYLVYSTNNPCSARVFIWPAYNTTTITTMYCPYPLYPTFLPGQLHQ